MRITYICFELIEAQDENRVEEELVVANTGRQILWFEEFVVVDSEAEVQVTVMLHETLIAEEHHSF